MRRDREAVEASEPGAIDATHPGTSQRGKYVAIGQDDESGFERRDNLFLESIRKVGRVEEDERELVERVARLGELDRRLHERRARPTRFNDAVATHFEPFSEQLDLRGSSDAVGPFNRNELSGRSFDWEIRHPLSVVPARLNATVCAVLEAKSVFRQVAHRELPPFPYP